MAIKKGNVDTAAKKRRAHIRSCAEVLRMLATKPVMDAEAQDMAAFLVFNLRGIHATIDESAHAWDDRNYWKKAESLREKWRWSRVAADKLEKLLVGERFQEVPDFLITLIPHFATVTINTTTRDDSWWCGAFSALKKK